MTGPELALLHARIDASRHYLEFGAGASTSYACASPGPETIESVESSPEFVRERLLSDPQVVEALASRRLTLHLVDLGPTKGWGKPRGSAMWRSWPSYSSGVFSRPSRHDTILVDGRFRIACALNALLHAPDDCTILIHDFWDRPRYHVLLEFLEEVGRADTFGEFRKKAGADRDRARTLLRRHEYRPADRFGLGELRAALAGRR
jgi:hypothetical protein